jgi:hypothetical protein
MGGCSYTLDRTQQMGRWWDETTPFGADRRRHVKPCESVSIPVIFDSDERVLVDALVSMDAKAVGPDNLVHVGIVVVGDEITDIFNYARGPQAQEVVDLVSAAVLGDKKVGKGKKE